MVMVIMIIVYLPVVHGAAVSVRAAHDNIRRYFEVVAFDI